MEENFQQEQLRVKEIRIGDFLWKCIFSWKKILIIGLICGIVLMFLKYTTDTKRYEHLQKAADMQKPQDFTSEEVKEVESVRELKKRAEGYRDYLDNAVIMQINPYKQNIIELQYYIKSDFLYNYSESMTRDYTEDLNNIYRNYVVSGEVSRKIIEEAGLDAGEEDLSELISIEEEKNNSAETVCITVAYSEKEKLEKISKVIQSLMVQKEGELQQFGSHQLELVSEIENEIFNIDLIKRRNNIVNEIINLDNQISDWKSTTTEQQLLLLEDQQEQMERSVNTAKKPSMNVKFFVLGFGVGVFVLGIGILLQMLFNPQLQKAEEIRDTFGVRLFGKIELPGEKTNMFSKIDNKLIDIRNRRRKKVSVQQQINMIIANVLLTCEQQRINYVYLSGSEYEQVDSKVLEKMKEEFLKKEIQVEEGNSVFYEPQSLKKAVEIGNIIFVEQVALSICDEILNELQRIKEHNINVLGAVVIEKFGKR